jgi:hypothetical protein
MCKRTLGAWQTGGLVALLLATGLVLGRAERGPSQEEPKKEPALKARADEKPAGEEKAKADESKIEGTAMPVSGGAPQTALINESLAKFWKDNSARPSRRATDNEFVRRVYLDLLGRIPTIWEVKQYESDSNRVTKRARLIHKLLYDKYYEEEFQNHWADIWTTSLLTRSGNRTYHAQMHTWLEEKFAKNAPWDEMVRELLTATGENNEEGAVNFVLAHLGEPQRDASAEGQFDAVPITSRTTRLFLGLQIQCTQCHNHPFNPEWKQSHFWGVNAFFRQLAREGAPLMRPQQMQMAAKLKLRDDPSYNQEGKVFYEDRQAVMHQTGPRFLDGKKPPTDGKAPRREALAQFVVDHDQFAKSFVNRMWGHFFGRGLNQNPAVDDFGEHNPVIHPELLDGLARGFREYKHNIKELMSWICNSEAYNLSCEANPTNNKPEHEVYFSRMLLKSMSPEQLYASLKTATDQPLKPTAATANTPKKTVMTRQAAVESFRKRNQGRQDWLSKLTRNFGDDEGNEIHFNGTVVQALLLMNGRELQAELSRKENNTIENAIKTGSPLNEIFLAALARRPTQKERDLLRTPKVSVGTPQMLYEDVLWALLNSNEFILNH